MPLRSSVSSTDKNGMKDARWLEGDERKLKNLENRPEALAKRASCFLGIKV